MTKPKEAQPVVATCRQQVAAQGQTSPALSRLESIAVNLDTLCLADPCVEHSHARLYVEHAILALRKKRAPPEAANV